LPNIKVAHFTTSADGGAAMLAVRLHDTLRKRGVESSIYYRRGELPGGVRLEFASTPKKHLTERVFRKWERMLTRPGINLFNRTSLPFKTSFDLSDPPDIVHLHWISQWLDLPSFLEKIPMDIPVVWTIHDFGALTGGCHLYLGCDRFAESCSPCPLLKSPFDQFVARKELQRKIKALSGRQVYVVGNSRWTTEMARRSRIFSSAAGFETIYPSIDTTAFLPGDRMVVRKTLGINPDVPVIGFGCADLGDKNKNTQAFFALLNQARALAPVEAVVFGKGIPSEISTAVAVHYFGSINSPRLLSLVYSAMDVFVLTSSAETFGQTALEAQACGVPVCAWNVGGLSEAIAHGKTGLLSQWGDQREILRNVQHLIASPELRADFGKRGIARATANFSPESAADNYMGVYELARRSSAMGGSSDGFSPHRDPRTKYVSEEVTGGFGA
jgi:glycosyltransferase involved in cell wall biosynthesis